MRRRMILAMVFVFALLLSLGYVRARFWIVELSYQTAQKREMRNKLLQEKSGLTVELETLRNPNRIERIAKEKLGLTRQQEPASVVVLQSAGGR